MNHKLDPRSFMKANDFRLEQEAEEALRRGGEPALDEFLQQHSAWCQHMAALQWVCEAEERAWAEGEALVRAFDGDVSSLVDAVVWCRGKSIWRFVALDADRMATMDLRDEVPALIARVEPVLQANPGMTVREALDQGLLT